MGRARRIASFSRRSAPRRSSFSGRRTTEPPGPTEIGDPLHALGRAGDQFAARYLRSAGHEILERNLRSPLGEIDLVTKAKDGTIVFVEVRTRSGPGAGRAALDSVYGDKRRRIWNAATAYLARSYPEEAARIDLIAMAAGPDGSLEVAEHVVNAIEEPG